MVAATEKGAAAADQIKTLAESAPGGGRIGGWLRAQPRQEQRPLRSPKPRKRPKSWLKKVDEATTAKTHVKVLLVDDSTQLTGERTALTDRLKLVLDKL